MSRLPRKAPEKDNRNEEVDGNILTYYIAGQMNKPISLSMVKKMEIKPLLTSEEMRHKQASGVLYQDPKVVLKEEQTITVNEGGILSSKATTNGTMEIVVPEGCRKTTQYQGYK